MKTRSGPAHHDPPAPSRCSKPRERITMTASAFGVTLTNTAHLYGAAAEKQRLLRFFTDVLELTPRQRSPMSRGQTQCMWWPAVTGRAAASNSPATRHRPYDPAEPTREAGPEHYPQSRPNTACLRGRPAVRRLAQNGQFWGVVELPAGGGRAFAVALAARRPLVLLPVVRGAAAVRAPLYRAG